MRPLLLERFAYFPDSALGTITLEREGPFPEYSWKSVEPPWRENASGRSCIPVGQYPLRETIYYGGDGPGGKRDYATYEIVGVPGRGEIKLHVANFAEELEGCPAPGLKWAINPKTGSIGVASSQLALSALLDEIRRRKITSIVVVNAPMGGLLN